VLLSRDAGFKQHGYSKRTSCFHLAEWIWTWQIWNRAGNAQPGVKNLI